jgi:hypothetical protein
LVEQVASSCVRTQSAIEELRRFCWVEPRLPDADGKVFRRNQTPLGLDADMQRADVVAHLETIRAENELAELAFYAYRDLNRTEAVPFIKAALERSPVSIAACSNLDDDAMIAAVKGIANESIYDEPGRLAQPDEVWNYSRGDGAEKALLLANLLRSRHPDIGLIVEVGPDSATVRVAHNTGRHQSPDAEGHGRDATYRFPSNKGLHPQTWDCRSSP